MTFNKAQGQTLHRELIDIRNEVFTHGFLYVGLSRVQHYLNIAFLLHEHQLCRGATLSTASLDGKLSIDNIVYQRAIRLAR
jgi:hypothetical protein